MFTLNCNGRILSLDQPRIMGILNLTPDSFSDGGKYNSLHAALKHTENMLSSGADIIDIGGYSSRPFAEDVPEAEELRRIADITAEIVKRFPEAFISIDTFRAGVAREMLEMGVHMINDISAGTMDPNMLDTVAAYPVPYVAMHMQGTPQTMQLQPTYSHVVDEVRDYFVMKIREVRERGIKDLILDPGLGFGKQILHNFQLLGALEQFVPLECPLLIGLSRKSMLYKLLECAPEETLEAASALNMMALTKGVHILRVHDVGQTQQIVKIFRYMRSNGVV